MTGVEWAEPWYRLLALLAIPAWWLARRAAGRVRFSSLRVLPAASSTWRTRLDWLPDALLALAIVSLAIAMAGPRRGREGRADPLKDGIAIVMVIDT